MSKVPSIIKIDRIRSGPWFEAIYTCTSGSPLKELCDEGMYKEIEKHLREDLMTVRWLGLSIDRMKEGRALFQEQAYCSQGIRFQKECERVSKSSSGSCLTRVN